MNKLTAIETAAQSSATAYNNTTKQPFIGQLKAGNYKKGRFWLHGLQIAIENPFGTYRVGMDSNGVEWRSLLAAHYGYICGTKGADGDAVDCFIGPYPQSDYIFVINQNVNGAFDEHKVMIGFVDEASAISSYQHSYDRHWQGLRNIVTLTIPQFKTWLKTGDLTMPIPAQTNPVMNLKAVYWDSATALPIDTNLDKLLYAIRQGDNGLMFDSASVIDIYEDADAVLGFDAMVTPYQFMERKMAVMQRVLNTTSQTLKTTDVKLTDPFTKNGSVNVAMVFMLSDGQTISAFFHNPDTTPKKLNPSDEMISWKWLINKKDVTIVVAPEKGQDLDVKQVCARLMKLAEKNSPAFQRANAKVAERAAQKSALITEIASLEEQVQEAQTELEQLKSNEAIRNQPEESQQTEAIETRDGNRVVISTNQNTAGVWESRLYINGGETATTTSAKHKTKQAAIKWANNTLAKMKQSADEVIPENTENATEQLQTSDDVDLPEPISETEHLPSGGYKEKFWSMVGKTPDTNDDLEKANRIIDAAKSIVDINPDQANKWLKNIRDQVKSTGALSKLMDADAIERAAKSIINKSNQITGVAESISATHIDRPYLLEFLNGNRQRKISALSNDERLDKGISIINKVIDKYAVIGIDPFKYNFLNDSQKDSGKTMITALLASLVMVHTKRDKSVAFRVLDDTLRDAERFLQEWNDDNLSTVPYYHISSGFNDAEAKAEIALAEKAPLPQEIGQAAIDTRDQDKVYADEDEQEVYLKQRDAKFQQFVIEKLGFEEDESTSSPGYRQAVIGDDKLQFATSAFIVNNEVIAYGGQITWGDYSASAFNGALFDSAEVEPNTLCAQIGKDGRIVARVRIEINGMVTFYKGATGVDILATSEPSVTDIDKIVKDILGYVEPIMPHLANQLPEQQSPKISPLDEFENSGGEAWQVTQAKWVEIMSGHFAFLSQESNVSDFKEFHKSMVKQAIDAGKDIPADVLADYPGMKMETDDEKQERLKKIEQNLSNVIDIASGKATDEEVARVMPLIKTFIGKSQLSVIKSALKDEEGQHFKDKLVEIANAIKTMPSTYETDGQGNNAIVYLHYFKGGMDWYITEKDKGDPEDAKNGIPAQQQAFGLADLGYGGELGYISIPEITLADVELDLYWTPKTLGEIRGIDSNDEQGGMPDMPVSDDKKAQFERDLDELMAETDIQKYDQRLDDIAARIEEEGLMDELDAKLNAAADVLTTLLSEAERKAV